MIAKLQNITAKSRISVAKKSHMPSFAAPYAVVLSMW
jgi:hypothetical protein